MSEQTIDTSDIIHWLQKLENRIKKYDTGWINRADWTNVHMGSDTTKDTDSNVTHNLDSELSKLIVKIFISTDGTDANSFEIKPASVDLSSPLYKNWGITIYQIDSDNIKVQTGVDGISLYVNDSGLLYIIDTEDWYYKIVVYKIDL